jgi:hypothetical protein
MIEIRDNFLPKEEFLKIQKIFLSDIFPWYFNNYKIDSNNEEGLNNYQFTHAFYVDYKIKSDAFEYLENLLKELKIKSIVKLKANLLPKTDTIIKSEFHTDVDFNCLTSILYINNNDGYTEFENGKIINSIENRLITFPSSIKHLGTTCTNSKIRVILNLNYF